MCAQNKIRFHHDSVTVLNREHDHAERGKHVEEQCILRYIMYYKVRDLEKRLENDPIIIIIADVITEGVNEKGQKNLNPFFGT